MVNAEIDYHDGGESPPPKAPMAKKWPAWKVVMAVVVFVAVFYVVEMIRVNIHYKTFGPQLNKAR